MLWRIIYKGCEGSDVLMVQNLLKNLGYDVMLTGYFGEQTDKAVKKFQNANELKPDGKVGQTTYTALKSK